MTNAEFPFHVRIEVSSLGYFKYVMKFYYATDLRLEQNVQSVDTQAIECWIASKPYRNDLNGVKF